MAIGAEYKRPTSCAGAIVSGARVVEITIAHKRRAGIRGPHPSSWCTGRCAGRASQGSTSAGDRGARRIIGRVVAAFTTWASDKRQAAAPATAFVSVGIRSGVTGAATDVAALDAVCVGIPPGAGAAAAGVAVPITAAAVRRHRGPAAPLQSPRDGQAREARARQGGNELSSGRAVGSQGAGERQ